MGSVDRSATGRIEQGAAIAYLPASARDAEVAALDDPWIGDEGPLEASFRPGIDAEPLRQRGLAFDARTTVVWDEDAVQVVRADEPEPGVVALRSRVIVRERFPSPGSLWRVDYLRDGALLASRYETTETTEGGNDA